MTRRSRFETWSRGLFGHPDKEEPMPSQDPYEAPLPEDFPKGEQVSNVDDTPHPEHPIVIPEPPPGDEPHPEHPIAGTDERPEHPIVIPPDEETPEVPEEELDFFQRTTLGFNWTPSSVGTEGEQVGVDAWQPEPGNDVGSWLNVRTVPNNGSSSVTYPADFTGDVKIRVRGSAGTVSGEATVT
jgi:hypothetical protein